MTISDFRSLAGLTNLEKLDLSHSYSLNDVTPLQGMTNLRVLNLAHTSVADLSPLEGLAKLEELVIHHTLVGNQEADRFQKALPKCKITR